MLRLENITSFYLSANSSVAHYVGHQHADRKASLAWLAVLLLYFIAYYIPFYYISPRSIIAIAKEIKCILCTNIFIWPEGESKWKLAKSIYLQY